MKLLLIIVASLLVGCNAGSGENLNEQGQPIEEIIEEENNKNEDNNEKSTLVWIQDNVFSPNCAVCHGGVNPAAGQNLSTIAESANSLINVASANPNFKRVMPGSALESYLYLKVIGDDQAGTRMPLGGSALSEEATNAIKEWITLGALVPQNSGISAKISTTNMVTKQRGSHKNVVLTLGFNQLMNFSTLNSQQILVSADSLNANRSVNSEKIKVSIINSHTIKIHISDVPLTVNKLKFSLNNNAVSSITSQSGQLFDGDNNKVDGGEYTYEHTF